MDNPREKCFQLLSEHYPTAEQLLTPKLIERALLKGGGLLLCQIEITTELSYCIKLAYGGRNSNGKEGELAILVQESVKNDDLARLSFMLNSKGDIYIAGLKASPTPNFREIIAQASKACSGLSPKRMAMEALFSLGACPRIPTKS
jgi:uncharacterized protein VirK/YbjX